MDGDLEDIQSAYGVERPGRRLQTAATGQDGQDDNGALDLGFILTMSRVLPGFKPPCARNPTIWAPEKKYETIE